MEHALQVIDRDKYPICSFSLSVLRTQYIFKNKIFNDLPYCIYQLANASDAIRKRNQSRKEVGELRIDSISIPESSNFDSVEEIIGMLVAALLVQLPIGIDMYETLTIWRANSSELPIKENMTNALDLIEEMLSEDENNALTVMKTLEAKYEKRVIAALKIICNIKTRPENLWHAHILITSAFINATWLDPLVPVLAEFLSAQWVEKTREIPIKAVSAVEQACNSNETGRRKIGQILLAVSQGFEPGVPSVLFQKFRNWANNPQESD